jgi:hypothetical protein
MQTAHSTPELLKALAVVAGIIGFFIVVIHNVTNMIQ